MKAVTISALCALFAFTFASEHEVVPLRHRHARRAGHKHHHKKHAELPAVKRQAQCQFPTDCGLVAVTPDQQNAGWAMSPNQPCLPGNYCPFACPSGQVMAQWDPAATSYTYPISMYGGLYCDSTGTISKPFPNQPYCVEGVGTFIAENECSEPVAVCQTVLPGNEAMLIPNLVPADGDLTLAVPDTSYWCSTSAEYYVNKPGYTTDQACIWGDGSEPLGNWAPFVTGANQAADGNTFVTVGANPIYWCQADSYEGVDPGFAVRIDCPSGNCNGMPCECNPATMGPNACTGGTVGAGGAQFCVVTVPAGETANLVIFSTSNGSVVSTAPVTNNAVTSPNVVSAAPVPAPAPAPVPAPAPPPPSVPAPASSSSSSCTTAEPSPVYQPEIWAQAPQPSTSTTTSSAPPSSVLVSAVTPLGHPSTKIVYVSPSNVGLLQNQGFPTNNATSSSVPSPSSPVLQTSSANRLTLTSLVSLLVVAMAMINL